MDIDLKEFGRHLTKLRRGMLTGDDKQMSQETLGSMLQISGKQIGKYERGIDKPSPLTLRKMCECFNVSGDTLLMLERDPVFSNYDMLTPAHKAQVKENIKILLSMEGMEWVEPGNSQKREKKKVS